MRKLAGACLVGLAVIAGADTPSRADAGRAAARTADPPLAAAARTADPPLAAAARTADPPLAAEPPDPCCLRTRDYRPRTQFVIQMLRSVEAL
jgi:hypothetical protein